MKFTWKNLFKRIKKDKTKTKEIKRPRNSYDIYNQNETLTLKTDLDKDLIAYNSNNNTNEELELLDKAEENAAINNIEPNNVNPNSEKKLRTFTSTTKIDRTPRTKKNKLVYFIYEKDDKSKNVAWQVKKENGSRALKTCKTKEETIEFVRNKATVNDSIKCIVKDKNGKIEETIVIDLEK
ncbi:DUF2188 domain-containing protein [Metamycoplasma sualvi]|uniref:DUF2188 domain-containing protein n=1 Tax=Metamycoplasma sualvi TaxID=2125 RepID=UPI003873C329